jgi:hypothetical protein
MADIPLIMDKEGRSRQMTAREYKQATGRISAAPRNPRYMSGLNSYYALQNRNAPAFSDPRRPNMSAREMGEDAASMGYTLGAQGLRPNYMPNNPQVPMTAEQRRQYNLDTAKADGSFARIRREFNARNSGKRMNNRGDIIDVEVKEKATPPSPKPDGTLLGLAGIDVEKLRPSFDALPTPPAATTPTPSAPVTAAQRRQMLADAASGRMDKIADGRITEIQSKYGTGSSKMYAKTDEERKTGARPSAIPQAMTIDEFGKPETMKSFLERRKAIQKSKGMI